MIVVLDCERTEADLTAGRLACPACGGRLRPWGRARLRSVRLRDGSSRRVRPRRVRCRVCRATQVLLPSWCQPRLADATEVIGAALAAQVRGHGCRRIAADLDRPASTVRRWLRRARDPGHQQWLRRVGVERVYALDQEILAAGLLPQPTLLGDALETLAAAVVAWRRRTGQAREGWALIGMFTSGRLLAAAPFR